MPSASRSSHRCTGTTIRSAPASSRYSQFPPSPGVRPMTARRSSRWSSTWTAVVGSLDHDAPGPPGPPHHPPPVDGLDRAGMRAVDDQRRRRGGERPGLAVQGRRPSPGRPLHRPAPGLRDERGDLHRAHAVEHPVEEDQEEHQRRAEEEAGEGDREVGHLVLLDATQQREGERDRPDADREHAPEGPVAEPEPHVAGREGAGGHLDHEHADRDDEAGQADGGCDDRGQHRLRGVRRVAPARGRLQPMLEVHGHRGEREAEERRHQRKHPEAAPDALAGAEAAAPHHWSGRYAGTGKGAITPIV